MSRKTAIVLALTLLLLFLPAACVREPDLAEDGRMPDRADEGREPGRAGDGRRLLPTDPSAPASVTEGTDDREPAAGFSDADFDEHLVELKRKVPGTGFTIVIEKPFVVIGDEAPERVRLRAERTVKWAVDHLKKKYFEKDPEQIIDIWLFRDETSYRKHAREIFGHEPDTPFGYSSPSAGALIMNIATGGGTLVHEIVHPFVRANFPDCPAWFNEGLASLYEQCGEEDGEIRGFTNWRLQGLQEAIRAGRVPSFATLTATSTHEFYEEDRGTNYAQARYLCYYLQEKGLLQRYFRTFRANREKDPTGFETLKKTLGQEDMAAFQEKWEGFVTGLTFP